MIHPGYTFQDLEFLTRIQLLTIARTYYIPDIEDNASDLLRSKILSYSIKAACGEYFYCSVTGLPSKKVCVLKDKKGKPHVCGEQVWEAVQAGIKLEQIISGGLPGN